MAAGGDKFSMKVLLILIIGGICFILILLGISLCICRCIWALDIPNCLTRRPLVLDLEQDSVHSSKAKSNLKVTPPSPDTSLLVEKFQDNQL